MLREIYTRNGIPFTNMGSTEISTLQFKASSFGVILTSYVDTGSGEFLTVLPCSAPIYAPYTSFSFFMSSFVIEKFFIMFIRIIIL